MVDKSTYRFGEAVGVIINHIEAWREMVRVFRGAIQAVVLWIEKEKIHVRYVPRSFSSSHLFFN